jgi:hypothetical protein
MNRILLYSIVLITLAFPQANAFASPKQDSYYFYCETSIPSPIVLQLIEYTYSPSTQLSLLIPHFGYSVATDVWRALSYIRKGTSVADAFFDPIPDRAVIWVFTNNNGGYFMQSFYYSQSQLIDQGPFVNISSDEVQIICGGLHT